MTRISKILSVLVMCILSTNCSLFQKENFDTTTSYSEPRFDNSGKHRQLRTCQCKQHMVYG